MILSFRKRTRISLNNLTALLCSHYASSSLVHVTLSIFTKLLAKYYNYHSCMKSKIVPCRKKKLAPELCRLTPASSPGLTAPPLRLHAQYQAQLFCTIWHHWTRENMELTPTTRFFASFVPVGTSWDDGWVVVENTFIQLLQHNCLLWRRSVGFFAHSSQWVCFKYVPLSHILLAACIDW
jgi:hypothetical protein